MNATGAGGPSVPLIPTLPFFLLYLDKSITNIDVIAQQIEPEPLFLQFMYLVVSCLLLVWFGFVCLGPFVSISGCDTFSLWGSQSPQEVLLCSPGCCPSRAHPTSPKVLGVRVSH